MSLLTSILALLAAAVAPAQQSAPAPAAAPAAPAPVLTPAAELARLQQAARTANSMGKFADAEASFREVLDLQTGALKASNEDVAATLIDIALNVSNQGRSEEAAALFRRAQPMLQASASPIPRARLATYQAYDAANRGDFAQGLAYAREATNLWRTLLADAQKSGVTAAGSASDGAVLEQGELANALNFQARMELRSDNVLQGYAAASEALLILNKEQSLPRWWRADSLLALGEISSAQGRLSAAETYLQASLKLRRQIFGDGASTIQVLAALGKAYQREGMNDSAIVTYREVFKIAHGLPSTTGVFNAEMLMPFASAVVAVADGLTDPAQKRGLYAEAFDAFQLVQSPIVDKTIAQAAARLSTDDPAIGKLMSDLQDRQRDYDLAHVRLAYEQSLPDNERSAKVENELKATLVSAQGATATARRSLLAQYPDYDRLVAPQPLKLDQIRMLLKPKEGVVSFLVGREQSFAQLVTRDGVVIAPVNSGTAEMRTAVTALRRPLEIQGGSVGDFNLAEANKMYELLLGGLKDQTAALDHLVVVPQGPLANLPFSMLVTAPANTGDYAGAQWLIRTKTISYTPSLASLVQLRSIRRASLPTQPLLGFGDPALTGHGGKAETAAFRQLMTSCREGGPMPAALLLGLAPLPDTARELSVVAKTLNAPTSDLFLEAKATEGNLRAQNLGDYRVLYFATHGLLPGELRCQAEPGLVLTPPSSTASDKAGDGLLESSEIAGLRLNADLVVLSACNTAAGDGKFGGGEALSGLAEAFFHAGARNMLVSHWQVPSAATASLMSGLFTDWTQARGETVGDALRQAQLALIAQGKTAHPFFWAAFVAIGDGLGTDDQPGAVKATRVASAGGAK